MKTQSPIAAARRAGRITRALGNATLLCLIALGAAVGTAQGATATRTSAFEYDPVSGLLIKEVIEPGDSNLCLVTTYGYDSYGNKTGATTRNCNGSPIPGTTNEALAPTGDAVITSRTSTMVFAAGSTVIGGTTYTYPAGQFPTTTSNALSHSETKEFDPRFGGATKLTGPNNLATTWTYDNFGRNTLETRSDGTKTQLDYLYCSGTNGGTAVCPTYGTYLVKATPLDTAGAQSGPISITYYDSLNREIRSETQGFAATGTAPAIYKDTYYDALGRVSMVSKPYYASAPVNCTSTPSACTVTTYDVLGRPLTQTAPTASSGIVKTTTTYNGLSVTVSISNNDTGSNLPNGTVQTKTTTQNSQGQTVSVTDVQGGNISYTYDPFGNLVQTIAAGVTTTMSYDLRGRKTGMVDPNMGTWSYAYSALGELKRQTDAKGQGQVTTMVYDVLGRMTQRNEVDLISKWFYDAYPTAAAEWDAGMLTGISGNCSKGIGKLCYSSADNGYRKLIGYETGATNAAARPLTTNTRIDGAYYKITNAYTAGNGRLDTITYPTGQVAKHIYTSLGYLHKVTNNSTLTYWEALTVSATGKITSEKAGNNVITNRVYDALERVSTIQAGPSGTPTSIQNLAFTYDTIGNLLTRVDNDATGGATTENFAYDSLNRLLSRGGTGPGITTQTVTYNANGNIASKSDVGTYVYGGTRPHAVTSITGTGALTGATFTYDGGTTGNGNMTQSVDPVLNTRAFTYTSYNMLSRVTRGTNSLDFVYGAEHGRLKETRVVSGVTTTVFFVHPDNQGGLLYEKEVSGTSTKHKHYINAPGGVVAVVTTGSVSTTEYWHKDHLGSVAVMSTTDAQGNPIVVAGSRRAFDPWGKSSVAGDGFRGFTSHEQFETFGIIHMNGRVYDPRLGRFTSADPTIQYPGHLQNYNRYSYIDNNPLSVADMSGYGFFKSLNKIHGWISGWRFAQPYVRDNPILGSVGTAAAGFIPYCGIWCAGGAAAYTTYTFGGSDSQIVKSFFITVATAYAFQWVGANTEANSFEQYAGHAAVGCAYGEASGSGCGRGAASAVAGKFITNQFDVPAGKFDTAQFVATIVAGGTASVIGGGKFANGAVTAAFGYLFNQMRGGLRGLRSGPFATSSGSSSGDKDFDAAALGVDQTRAAAGSPPPDDDDGPKRFTHDKHHPNSASPEPKNVDALWNSRVIARDGTSYAVDSQGTIHRFSRPSNGMSHWNGSTSGVDPIQLRNIPVEVKRLLGVRG